MMAEERTARPVFGEIMTGPATAPRAGAAVIDAAIDAGQIVDADYETVEPAVASTRMPRGEPRPRPPHGMGMLRKGEAGGTARRGARGGPVFWLAGGCAIFAAFWIAGGHSLVRQTVFAAGDLPPGGALTISSIASRVDRSGLKPVLIVDGEAGNDGSTAAVLPPLAISVADSRGGTTRYTLGTAGHSLAPGERFAFSSRLDVPRNGVKTVSVTFAE